MKLIVKKNSWLAVILIAMSVSLAGCAISGPGANLFGQPNTSNAFGNGPAASCGST